MPEDARGKLSIVPDERFKAFASADAAATRKPWRIHPQETLLLRPSQEDYNEPRATVLLLDLPSMEERYRLTGKSIAVPQELLNHLNECSLILDMSWSPDSTYASLEFEDHHQR